MHLDLKYGHVKGPGAAGPWVHCTLRPPYPREEIQTRVVPLRRALPWRHAHREHAVVRAPLRMLQSSEFCIDLPFSRSVKLLMFIGTEFNKYTTIPLLQACSLFVNLTS